MHMNVKKIQVHQFQKDISRIVALAEEIINFNHKDMANSEDCKARIKIS